MPSIFTLEGATPRRKPKSKSSGALSGLDNFGADYDANGCKCVFNSKTGVWRKGCKNSKGQFRFTKETCR